jgi:SWI/SNF-related matrix-associated actin-dependent regulator of chromatin subfamily A member 5
VLSKIIRLYHTKCRLLITGTPLQNNLHELWALLNFLLPDVFGSSDDFADFTSAVEAGEEDGEEGGGDARATLVQQLHTVLRPFILRRLKKDVERDLPTKTELTVYCPLSKDQLTTYRAVLKNNADILNGAEHAGVGGGGGRVKLLNVVMQLRKAANHPYLHSHPPLNARWLRSPGTSRHCLDLIGPGLLRMASVASWERVV